MTAEEVIAEIEALDSQTKDIVMQFLDLLLQAQRSQQEPPAVPALMT